jgi:glutamate racemase
VPLRNHLAAHQVSTAFELAWGRVENGELLKLAEEGGFEVLVTTDQNLKYQQNLSNRKIAIVILSSTSWPRIQKVLKLVVDAVGGAQAGGYVEIFVPYSD